jgi:hypothetical protein|nr:MAG TPA: hypothetical protein [Caudoviricetes sp.]
MDFSFGELIRNVEWESDVHIFAPKETSYSSLFSERESDLRLLREET